MLDIKAFIKKTANASCFVALDIKAGYNNMVFSNS